MTQNSPLVFIVDDDLSIRESLELLIRCAGWTPETFASADEFLARPPSHAPCCLLLDIGLPGLSGLELQQLIVAHRTEIQIVFITACDDIPTTVRAMKAGAREFLTKPLDGEILLGAVRQALERSQIALAHQEADQRLLQRHASLSPRERQVMTLVGAGLLNKQVGGELGISEITVKAHRGKVMQKMSARSIADLVGMASRLDLHRSRDPAEGERPRLWPDASASGF